MCLFCVFIYIHICYVYRITDQSDFAIFDALKTKNFSLAMDMIDEQKGMIKGLYGRLSSSY